MGDKATIKRRFPGLLPLGRRSGEPSEPGTHSRLSAVPRWVAGHYLQLLAVAFVGSIAAFAIYYYMDRRVDSGPTLVQRQLTTFEEAVRKNPADFSARMSLATAYEGMSNNTAALKQYEAALAIQKDDPQALLGVGRMQLAVGDSTGAAASFQKVIDQRGAGEFANVDTSIRDAEYFLGEIGIQKGDFAKAADNLTLALQIDSVDADAWWKLCEARNGTKEYDKAIDACSKATQLVPTFTEAYQQMARAFEGAGKTLDAAYANAMATFGLGNYPAAISQLNSVVQQDPKFAEAFVGLGLAHEAAGDRDQALSAYKQALTADSQNLLALMGVNRLTGAVPSGAALPSGHP